MENALIHFLAPREGADFPLDYIARAGLEERADVLCYEDLLDRSTLPHGLYVFTGINRLGPASARLFGSLHEQIEAATGITPLNHPLQTLRRYELLRALHREGLNRFTAYGVWEDYSAVRLPAFVRPREADGGIPTLAHTLAEVDADVGRALMDGRKPDELVVIEFEDTSVDGVFTKYSAYGIGGRIVPVSLDRGTDWVMRRHASDIDPAMLEDERRFVFSNPHREQLDRIFSLSRTGFGRIDYSVADGRVVCWEINTLPLLRRVHAATRLAPELDALRQPRKQFVASELTASFSELLAQLPSGAAFGFDPDPAQVEQARAEIAERGATTDAGSVRFRIARTLLRPLKPILKPIAAVTLHPLLARRARWAAKKA
jgi:hypothetical protein